MRFLFYCHQALGNLFAAKLRSFLAVLGILVGTAAVVALISCGELATAKALQEFKSLGTDLLSISVFQNGQGLREEVPLVFWREKLKYRPYVLDMAPYATVYQPISFEGQVLKGAIIGADESLHRYLV